MSITVTEIAAKEIQRIITEQNLEKVYLRMKVVGSGCSGFETKLDFDTETTEKDQIFESNGINVVVDKKNLIYVENAKIDYLQDLNKKGFVVTNPDVKNTCGCGKSWSM